MKKETTNLTLDKVANLYNKTKDEKYKKFWYQMVHRQAALLALVKERSPLRKRT